MTSLERTRKLLEGSVRNEFSDPQGSIACWCEEAPLTHTHTHTHTHTLTHTRIGYQNTYTYSKKIKLDPKFIDFMYYNALTAIAVGFGSAALFQATYNYLENPAGGFNFKGGITFIGGLIGGAASFLIVYVIFRKKLTGRLYEAISMPSIRVFSMSQLFAADG